MRRCFNNMKVYTLIRRQFLPVDITTAWNFFSSPANLARITPAYMGFRILHLSGNGKMFAGQIIRYRLFVFPHLPFHWTTEITHVAEPSYFVDEQRAGPYALWHHQHHFTEVDGGIEMTDELHYALPFGLLGRFFHAILVKKQLNTIFDYRFSALRSIFKSNEQSIRRTA